MSTILEALKKATRQRRQTAQPGQTGQRPEDTKITLQLSEDTGDQKIAAEHARAHRFVRRVGTAAIASTFILLAVLGALAVLMYQSRNKPAGFLEKEILPQAGVPNSLQPTPPAESAGSAGSPPAVPAGGAAPIEDHATPAKKELPVILSEAKNLEARTPPKPRIERADLPPTYLKIAAREAQPPIGEIATVKTPAKKKAAQEDAATDDTQPPAKPKKKTTSLEDQADQTEETEPAQATPRKPKELPASGPVEPSDLGLTLDGIVWDKQKPLAMINGQILAVGQEIEGYSITKIQKTSVEVKKDNRTFTLKY